jgi:hypothetical protein
LKNCARYVAISAEGASCKISRLAIAIVFVAKKLDVSVAYLRNYRFCVVAICDECLQLSDETVP